MNGFSGQTIYDPFLFQLYNIFYSSLPIVIYSLFDKENKGSILLKNPELFYYVGQKDKLFNKYVFWSWIFYGVWQSCLIVFPSFYGLSYFYSKGNGWDLGFWASGMTVFGFVIIVTNIKILLFSNTYSLMSLSIIFGSIFLYYITYAISSAVGVSQDTYGGCARYK